MYSSAYQVYVVYASVCSVQHIMGGIGLHLIDLALPIIQKRKKEKLYSYTATCFGWIEENIIAMCKVIHHKVMRRQS